MFQIFVLHWEEIITKILNWCIGMYIYRVCYCSSQKLSHRFCVKHCKGVLLQIASLRVPEFLSVLLYLLNGRVAGHPVQLLLGHLLHPVPVRLGDEPNHARLTGWFPITILLRIMMQNVKYVLSHFHKPILITTDLHELTIRTSLTSGS